VPQERDAGVRDEVEPDGDEDRRLIFGLLASNVTAGTEQAARPSRAGAEQASLGL
jgi:hypothetical protein